jgi:hypothetical protein
MHNKNKTARIATWLALCAAAVFAPMTAEAQLAGRNVILVHGFISEDLIKAPTDAEVLARRKLSEFWQARAEGYLNWSGAERLEGGIARMVFEQAKGYAAQGLCNNGCVLVTHSTGDLVARYFMQNQANWLRNAGYQPLNIIATLDYAGAGGGTDLADVAVAAANSEYVPEPLKWAAGMVMGLDLDVTDYDELGVVIDLQTSVSRSHAMAPQGIPRLRFSASGGDLLEIGMGQVRSITKTMIRGADDTVVPAHSSCGASAPDAIESCSGSVNYEGKRTGTWGPRGLLPNHYPLLMAANYDHFNITQDEHHGLVTYVFNNFVAGLRADFVTYTKTVTRNWWELWKETGTWQYVRDSDTRSMTRLIYDTFNS